MCKCTFACLCSNAARGAGRPLPRQRAPVQDDDELGGHGVLRAVVGPEAGVRHKRVRPATHEPPLLRALHRHREDQETPRHEEEEQESSKWPVGVWDLAG